MSEEGTDKKPSINQLIEEFNNEAIAVAAKMRELAELTNDVTKMADGKHKIYNYRADLVKRKLELMTASNRLNRTVISQKRKVYDGYKLGKPVAGSNTGMMPKNDYERQLYVDSDLRNENFHLKLIDDQLQFIVDQIKGVDNIIFGIEYVIALQQYKTSMGKA